MAYHSIAKLRGSSGQSEFQFNFPYLRREDIKVFVEGATAPFSFTSSNTVSLLTPLEKASNVVIRRTTEREVRAVDFNNVAELTEADLDADSLQAFYLVQEALDTASEAVVKNEAGDWDVGMGRIVNLADAVDDYDALNLNTFHRLNSAYTSSFSETLAAARKAVEDANKEAARAGAEADYAEAIKEQVQGIYEATDDVLNDARAEAIKAQNERQKAEQAVVDSKKWADTSEYWYEVFRTFYLGVKNEHPGGSITPGAMYYNTNDNRLYFYNGSLWYSPTTDAEKAETARRVAESVRNEVTNMRDQVRVFMEQSQEAVGMAIDSANEATREAAKSRNEAALSRNHADASEAAATKAEHHSVLAIEAKQEAVAAADQVHDTLGQVGETFGDRGAWYVAHGMPNAPVRSAMWSCMDGGELNGVEWVPGDILMYSIKTGSWGRITGTSLTAVAPAPVEFDEGVILSEGKNIRARVGGSVRWLSHADSDGVKIGDGAVELCLMGNNLVFGALKERVYHEGFAPAWDTLRNKPTTFPPATHAHAWNDISGKPVAATRWPTWYEVTDKPTSYPAATHAHSWNEVSNKPDTALRWPTAAEAGALPVGSYNPRKDAINASHLMHSYHHGVDLDTLAAGDTGLYEASTCPNSPPSAVGAFYYVETKAIYQNGGAPALLQIAQPYDESGFFWRNYSLNTKTWSSWHQFYDSKNKPTAADVGALPSTSFGGDLNTLSVSGFYRLDSVSNSPAGRGGVGDQCIHQQWDSNAAFQIYTAYSTGQMWTRNKMGGNWKAWSVIYSDASKPTAADVGAAPSSHGHSWGEISGIPATATRWPTAAEAGAAPIAHRETWADKGLHTQTAHGIGWNNYGNGHIVCDASGGSLEGVPVNKRDAAIPWDDVVGATLVGWNGSATYGVRVDRARLADQASRATDLNGVVSSSGQDLKIHGKRALVGVGTANQLVINYGADWGSTTVLGPTYLQAVESNRHVVVHNGATHYGDSGLEVRSTDGTPAILGFHRSGHGAASVALKGDGVLEFNQGNGTTRARIIVGEVDSARVSYVDGGWWVANQGLSHNANHFNDAPFQVNFGGVPGDSHAPLVSGVGYTNGSGYTTRVKLGLRTYPGAWSAAELFVGSAENSAENGHPRAVYAFDAYGNFSAPGKVNCQGDVTTTSGLIGFSAYINGPQQGSANALTRKDYVDGQINTRAPASHSHDYAASNHTHTAASVGAMPARGGSETILWEGVISSTTTSIQLSAPIGNYSAVRFIGRNSAGGNIAWSRTYTRDEWAFLCSLGVNVDVASGAYRVAFTNPGINDTTLTRNTNAGVLTHVIGLN